MKIMTQIKRVIISQKKANKLLFSGCANGDLKSVKRAVLLGADVNAKKKLGTYTDSVGGHKNPDWEGDVYATPIIVAATNALGADCQDTYQDIIKFLIAKGAKTSDVISGEERVWNEDDMHICGYSPSIRTSFHHSLGTVLKWRKRQKLGHNNYRVPNEMYPIADDMALFLHGLATDELARREQIILDKTYIEREDREYEMYVANLYHVKYPVEHVIKLRTREEKARLKIAKNLLLEKYEKERS